MVGERVPDAVLDLVPASEPFIETAAEPWPPRAGFREYIDEIDARFPSLSDIEGLGLPAVVSDSTKGFASSDMAKDNRGVS